MVGDDSLECELPSLLEESSEMWATQLRETNSKCKKELRFLESPTILYPAGGGQIQP